MARNWKPGINHIEFWVSDLKKSLTFYTGLFQLIGWKTLGETAFSTGEMEIYFKQVQHSLLDTLGPRHICFQAVSRKVVDDVYEYLRGCGATIIRGPMEIPQYSEGYYTVDFRDPDGYIIEVAYTPNMVL